MLLSDIKKYKKALEAINKKITYMPIELKKKLEEENIILFEILKINYTFLRYNLTFPFSWFENTNRC